VITVLHEYKFKTSNSVSMCNECEEIFSMFLFIFTVMSVGPSSKSCGTGLHYFMPPLQEVHKMNM